MKVTLTPPVDREVTITMSESDAKIIATLIAKAPCGVGGMSGPIYKLHVAFQNAGIDG